ncbi:5' nucleotidase, NT5C type [Flavobacterium cerinum]|uniref:5'(3')-deoxyribonucleotidase n=1 Tax=Flavobacterium cerinum TaxID=2502784 RepID=A0A444HEW6_9FLAO|nr:5'(3')-deoxyribonucleotidase [Flavobacterium cerinum]RWX03491.1 5'(3')-deoxyribonucleotidase [Flavobacterium cerinum]
MKKSIAIDMDGVIADIEPHLIEWYQKETGIITAKETIRGLNEHEAFSNKGAILKILNSPSFFRTVPVMDKAVETVKALMEEYEIFIVSAAMEFPLSLFEKKEWLSEHFPFISWKNIIFCGDKSIIDTDFMIDDYCKNLDFCKGKPLMFTAYHNVHLNHHQRIDHWNEVPELLKQLSSKHETAF